MKLSVGGDLERWDASAAFVGAVLEQDVVRLAFELHACAIGLPRSVQRAQINGCGFRRGGFVAGAFGLLAGCRRQDERSGNRGAGNKSHMELPPSGTRGGAPIDRPLDWAAA